MTDRMFKVTVVIVTYQSSKTIRSTLDVLKKAYDAGLADVVVVDNVSIDGTAEIIEENYPWVILVRNTENAGFGRGCNHGFKYARSPYVMFLNPDAVIEPRALTILLDFMDHNPRAGICGPVFRDLSGEVASLPMMQTPWRIIADPIFGRWIYKNERYVYPGDAPVMTEWIRGACMLLRREVFEDIGEFDSRFFLYFEETDLCHRIKQSGLEIWVIGEAICDHEIAASAKETGASLIFGDLISEHYFKSRFYYMVKHFGWLRAILTEIGELVFMAIRFVLDLARGRLYKPLYSRLQAPVLKLPLRIDNKEGNI